MVIFQGLTGTIYTAWGSHWDATGNMHLILGNGTFDASLDPSGFPLQGDCGNCYAKISSTSRRDQFAGNKFITPTVANGRVYVGTPNSVAVFGLLP